MNNPLIDVLFPYDSWATRRLLEECQILTREQLEQPLGLGHGNLERTLLHLIGSMMFFADRLNRNPPRTRPDHDNIFRTPKELLELFDLANRDLQEAIAKTIASHSLTDLLNWTDTDEDEADIDPLDRISYAVALAQMIDHNIHHRTQVTDMFALLGIEKTIELHPFEWEEAARSQS
jgi:uncharacterized damage-inducible protein DinB